MVILLILHHEINKTCAHCINRSIRADHLIDPIEMPLSSMKH